MYKILHLYRTFFPDTQGGAEEVIRQLAHYINDSSAAEIRVLVPSKQCSTVETIRYQNITIIRVPELLELASCNVFHRGFTELKTQIAWADIVHYHYPWPFQDVLHFLFVAHQKKKTVVTYHSDIVRQKLLGFLYSPLQNRFLASVDRIVATSPNYLESSPVLQKYKHKVDVVPLGLDEATITQSTSEARAWVKTNFPQPFFLFVGVLRYYKGLHVLLKAAAQTGLPVVIAGDGPEKNNLLQLKRQLNADNVYIIGRTSDEQKAALFEACQAFILPSYLRSEAFGVVLLEAMYFGKAMITTTLNTGVTFANLCNETGLTVEPASATALSNAMLLLAENEAMVESMGSVARRRYKQQFTALHFGQSYLQLYSSLLR